MSQGPRPRGSPASRFTARATPGAEGTWESPRPRTLVIEPNTAVADSVASALRIAGHLVETASIRADALALMKRHRYDLVVSDLRMPALGGPSLYEELARHSPRTPPSVIFITQSAFSPEYSKFLMDVGIPLLVKPVSPTALWETAARLLATRQG